MKLRDEKAEFAAGIIRNMKLHPPVYRKIDSPVFDPNYSRLPVILGVPRDFLFPRVLPPVGPQKPTG